MSCRAAVLVPLLLLAGCMTAPPSLDVHEPQPLAPGAFRLSKGSADPAAPASPAEALAVSALQARGFRPAAEDQAADYVLQVSVADRPKATRAFLPQAAGAAPKTLQAPPPKSLKTMFSKGVLGVHVQLSDAKTGAAAYDARAGQPYRKRKPADLDALIATAMAPLKLR